MRVWRVALALAVALAALSSGATAAPLWIDGELRFVDPASVTARVTFDRMSVLYWDAPAGNAPLFSAFAFSTPLVDATFVQEFHCLQACPTQLHPPQDVVQGPSSFRNAVVTMDAIAGKRTFLVSQAPASEGTLNIRDWQMSTVSGEEALAGPGNAADGGDRRAVPVRNVMLAGEQIVVQGFVPQAVDIYGFEVAIEHDGENGRETTVFRTGERPVLEDPVTGRPAAPGLVTQSWLSLAATAGALDIVGASVPARIVAPFITLDGDFEFPTLDGEIQAGTLSWRFQDEPLALEGAFLFRAVGGSTGAPGDDGSADLHRLHIVGGADSLASPAPLGPAPTAGDAGVGPAIAAVGIAAALLALLARGAFAAPLALLRTRLGPADLSRSPVRSRLLSVVADDPGIAMREAAREAGCAWGSVAYHVAVLQQLGAVRIEAYAGRRRLFPAAASATAADRAAASALRHAALANLLRTLDLAPAASQGELAARAGISQSQVSRLLRRAEAAGLVVGDRARVSGLGLTAVGARLVRGVETVRPGVLGPEDLGTATV